MRDEGLAVLDRNLQKAIKKALALDLRTEQEIKSKRKHEEMRIF
jgi:hypothetical protein